MFYINLSLFYLKIYFLSSHILNLFLSNKTFISVILPLKLGWQPCYYICLENITENSFGSGSFVRVLFAKKEYTGVVYKVGIHPDTNEEKIQEIICQEKDIAPVSNKEIQLWEFVSEYYLCSIGEVFKAAYPLHRLCDAKSMSESIAKALAIKQKSISRLNKKIGNLEVRLDKKRQAAQKSRKLEKKQEYEEAAAKIAVQIEKTKEEIEAITGENIVNADKIKSIHLSESQKKACSQIEYFFNRKMTVLLNGITGSGKTEIYLKIASQIIAAGKNVLYLVPEIALSRQLEDRLSEIFGNRLLIYHSKETASNRKKVVYNIEKGNYILIGTRSSVFLPHRNLGLVIIDEEHDTSYKQDSPSPRYNGRDTAAVLAQLHNAKLILGSATPSLESIYNCETKRYAMVTLNERFYEAANADIEIIDTKAERQKRGMNGCFSLKLIYAIKKTLDSGGQIIILRGRRAYSPIVQCENCGNIPRCPNCNVNLSYNKTENRLTCHYCGYKEYFNGICNKCGGEIKPIGYGTQRIEEEAKKLFPDASVARLDSDTSRNSSNEIQIIRDFAKGKINILIGTQMVAKGFDFKGLMLVAVIQADTILGQQDFRADEKALQLLEQFKGRCGRRDDRGKFIIQTSQPEHPIYTHLAGKKSKNDNILQSLLEERKIFNYPPFSRMVNIIIKDIDKYRIDQRSYELTSIFGKTFSTRTTIIPANDGAPIQITGPYPPVIDKIAKEYIRHIRIMLKKDNNLTYNKLLLKNTISDFEKAKSYYGHIIIDVDPIQ